MDNKNTYIYIGASIGKSLISKIIKYFQNGISYTHVFYIFNDQDIDHKSFYINDLTTIEAWHLPLYTLGNVYYKKNNNYKLHKSNTKYIIFKLKVTQEQKDLIELFLFKQIGKHYDYLAIFSFIIHGNLEEKKAWFCDELLIAAFKYANLDLWKNKAYKNNIAQFLTGLVNSNKLYDIIDNIDY